MARRKTVTVKAKVLPKVHLDGTIDKDFYKPVFKGDQETSVCMDVKAKIDSIGKFQQNQLEVHPGAVVSVRTGVFLELPPGWEAEVRPRSGLAKEYGITVVNAPGTIDTGYRGEIIVLLSNIRHMKSMNHWNVLSGLPFLIGIDARRLGLVETFYVEGHQVEFIQRPVPTVPLNPSRY